MDAGATDADAPPADATTTADRLPGWLVVYLKGVCMGVADAVPGVSGGTIALITGIYERLVVAIAGLDAGLFEPLARAHTPAGRADLRRVLVAKDVPFLAVLGLGVVSAIVALSRVVHWAITVVPGPTFGFFAGLILASAAVLSRQAAPTTPGQAAAGAAGVALAFVLAGETATGGVPHSLPVVAATGAVAVTAMVLPGVSGAFLLLLLGQYEFLTGRLSAFVDAVVGLAVGGDPGALAGPASVVAAFAAGALVGLLTVAHGIRYALDRNRVATIAFLVGLMAGALRYPVAEVAAATTGPAAAGLPVLAALVGAAAVFALDRYTDDLDYA